MTEEIKQNLDNPRQLEKMYRENKLAFKRDFNLVYQDIQQNPIARVWHERLNFEAEEISWGSNNELIFVIVSSLVAGFIAKIPSFTGITEDFFYARNLAFVVFPLLAAYFIRKQQVQAKRIVSISAIFLTAAVYINILPENSTNDTLILACIHLPLFLWAVLGYTFVGNQLKDVEKRLDFLRYNGDLAVMTAIILIAGIILTVLTLGLFLLIDVSIEEFYFEYVVVFGLAASPIVGTYLVQQNPELVNKVSPVIARVFTPLVLVTLVIYLLAIISTGEDPYNDREFLLIFNLLLIGVMAIILFSIAEKSKQTESRIGTFLLLALSVVTVIINGIALSAIVFRISAWGITPNRLAVLGSNILMLLNLLIVTFNLFKSVKNKGEIYGVEKSIATFLPIYSAWTMVVVFVFPLLFNFK
jgi:hypothetical protein